MNEPVTINAKTNNYSWSVDWLLLAFLCFFTMDKVFLKPIVLLLATILLIKQLRLSNIKHTPLFYSFITLIEVGKFLFLNNDFSIGHIYSFITGECYWIMCILAFVIIFNRVQRNNVRTLHNSISAFFYINFIWSITNLVIAMILAGTWNPYSSPLVDYGNSTGDRITGIFMAPCYINAFFNSFATIYFLHKKKYFNSFMAILVVCITTSNFVNVIFLPLLLVQLLVLKDKKARYTILGLLFLFIAFYLFASYGNFRYTVQSLRPRENKAVQASPGVQQNTPASDSLLTPNGKTVSAKETVHFLLSSPKRFVFGAGMGNFSSLLAIRTSDLKTPTESRIFQKYPRYISPDFYQNHYRIYEAIYKLPPGYHSTKHLPTSFFNQLLGEYGMLGAALFLLFYIWFIVKKYKKLSYTISMAFLLGCYLLFDYLFEYLSIVVLFEFFFLLNLKENTEETKTS